MKCVIVFFTVAIMMGCSGLKPPSNQLEQETEGSGQVESEKLEEQSPFVGVIVIPSPLSEKEQRDIKIRDKVETIIKTNNICSDKDDVWCAGFYDFLHSVIVTENDFEQDQLGMIIVNFGLGPEEKRNAEMFQNLSVQIDSSKYFNSDRPVALFFFTEDDVVDAIIFVYEQLVFKNIQPSFFVEKSNLYFIPNRSTSDMINKFVFTDNPNDQNMKEQKSYYLTHQEDWPFWLPKVNINIYGDRSICFVGDAVFKRPDLHGSLDFHIERLLKHIHKYE